MRSRAGRAAVALAALALAAAGCTDLVSSLTPFGLGDRGPDQSQTAYSGIWQGSTSASGDVTFNVVNNEIADLALSHVLACGQPWGFTTEDVIIISDGQFSATFTMDPQGTFDIQGDFTSPAAVRGSYAFRGIATPAGCETSGSGSFTATKLSQP